MACFLLHNFSRHEMPMDPIEAELDGAQDNPILEDEVIGTSVLSPLSQPSTGPNYERTLQQKYEWIDDLEYVI